MIQQTNGTFLNFASTSWGLIKRMKYQQVYAFLENKLQSEVLKYVDGTAFFQQHCGAVYKVPLRSQQPCHMGPSYILPLLLVFNYLGMKTATKGNKVNTSLHMIHIDTFSCR